MSMTHRSEADLVRCRNVANDKSLVRP